MSVKLFDHCTVPGCLRPHESLGLCGTHLKRLQQHGSVMAEDPIGYKNKLNLEKARAMRDAYDKRSFYFDEKLGRNMPEVTAQSLAKEYGVCKGTVDAILVGRFYKEVENV